MSVAPFPSEVRLPLGGIKTSDGERQRRPGDGVCEPRPPCRSRRLVYCLRARRRPEKAQWRLSLHGPLGPGDRRVRSVCRAFVGGQTVFS